MRITSLQLLTADLKEAEKFYHQTLGFELLAKTVDSITFKAGASTLTFRESKPDHAFYHFAFNIPSNHVNEALDWLTNKAQIFPFSEGSIIVNYTNWNSKAIYFLDTIGNIVELIARFDLGITSTGHFNAAAITEISEIGIVVDEVYAATEEITQKYGLPIFRKQPRLDNFTAIGDDEGLFIVVDKNKNWYPTEIRAKPFPFKASVVQDKNRFNFEFLAL